MSHYAEYSRGIIDRDEFISACNREFAGEDDLYNDCAHCPYYKKRRVDAFTIRRECEYDFCLRDEEREEERRQAEEDENE